MFAYNPNDLYVQCECGTRISKRCYVKHLGTDKHKKEWRKILQSKYDCKEYVCDYIMEDLEKRITSNWYLKQKTPWDKQHAEALLNEYNIKIKET